MSTYVMNLDDQNATLETTGGKGASLARLATAGLPVPGGFHITTDAYRQFVASNDLQPRILAALEPVDASQPATLETASQAIRQLFMQAAIPTPIADAITQAYDDLSNHTITQSRNHTIDQSPNHPMPVAVRSSATAEDLPDASFAGQQETYLNIRGTEAVLEAVKKCWASLWTARAIGYRARQNIDPDSVALAVVVQELVFADAAGIMFTANPMNGSRNETVINAAWGLGEAIVGGMVTPDTLTVEKSNRRVMKREIADKQVMTIRIDGGTEEQAVPEPKRQTPVLDNRQAAELAQIGMQIEKLYGAPMDIEWTLADGKFAIVQARPITALSEPPIEWKRPNPKGTYMRGSIVDLMPDPVSPLFASMGLPGVIAGVMRIGRTLTRSEPALPRDYFLTINSYAYSGVSFNPKEWRWVLFHLLPSTLRIFRMGIPVWRDEVHPYYQSVVARWREQAPDKMPVGELWRGIGEVVETATYYIGTLMFATMGSSAGAEMLLTRVYDAFARREGDPPATTLLMGWDNIPARSEKSLYDLAIWCRGQEALATFILKTPSEELVDLLASERPPKRIDAGDWQAFHRRFDEHLQRFGYIVYQLDFAQSLPLDQPAPMLETIKMYLRGEGVNPHERQKASEQKRIQTAETMLGRLKGLKLWAFRKALAIGQTMAEVREDALADIGLGYPLLRRMLHELGGRFAEAGAIEQADDIYWLEKDEIDTGVAALASCATLAGLAGSVAQRKAFWQRMKQITPPSMIPLKERFMGIKMDAFRARTEEEQTGNVLSGVPTSPGKVTAPACVLHGPEDFGRMKPGDVLVAGTTTPAWTPLFAMASAVVTDIGGPLSHGSIVAREYGIPAVMSTGVATRRIQSGQMITVDGEAGTIKLLGD